VPQGVEHLLSKYETSSSNTSTAKRKTIILIYTASKCIPYDNI
jgi:hypothetical protein